MIEVSWHHLFTIPLAVNLLSLLVFACYYALRQPVAVQSSEASRIYKCSSCEHVYIDARDIPLARCPRCDTLNEAVKR